SRQVFDESEGRAVQAISVQEQLQARLQRVLRTAARAFGASAALIVAAGRRGDAPLAAWGFDDEPEAVARACRAWAASLHDVSVAGLPQAPVPADLRDAGVAFCAGTPLHSPVGRPLGALALFGRHARRWS